jgi:hypothetical protein
MRHVNKIKKKNEAASAEVVDGVTEFVQNMQRLGIEDGANLEALDRPISTGSTWSLQGFSYAATMNKIKEKKR